MSADKRTVTTDALETLGTVIGEGEKRDAIHLAVENVIAGHPLVAGQHVGLRDGKAYIAGVKLLGIVDPFLAAPVNEGQRFWLVVYPRQIKSLRHVWEHPDFPVSGETAAAISPSSEQWLRNFADTVGLHYNDLMQGAKDWVDGREYLVRGGLLEGESVPDEFWPHYEAVTGKQVAEDDRQSFFSCSC